MDVSNIVLLHGAVALIVLAAAEIIFFKKEHFFNSHKKDMLASLSLGICSVVVGTLAKGTVLLIYSAIYEYRLFTLPMNLWWVWVICFFGDDFSFYWFHRMSHQVRFLWASHSVHHTSEIFSLASGLRVPVTSHLTGNFLFWAWMPLIGIEPAMILAMKSLSLTYQFFVHTEAIKKLPGLVEAVFITPSHHRVHHGSDVEYLDKNHGGVLIIWDKLFGSFQEEFRTPVYGLANQVNSTNPVAISFQEYKKMGTDLKKASSIKESLNYLVNAPGWSKDGTSKTAKQLQSNLKKEAYLEA